jgi:excisionase family DNA binding protein
MDKPTEPRPFRLLLRPQEAADALGISLRGLMNMVDHDEIPYVRIGVRNLRFSVDDLRAWIAERSTRQPAVGNQPPC